MKNSFETTRVSRHESTLESSSFVRDALEGRYGFKPQEIDALEQQAEVMQPHTSVVVRTPLSALEGIIREGHLQAASETGTSNGLTGGTDKDLHRLDEYLAMRREFESKKLQWSEDEPAIVYGFLGYDVELDDNNIQAPVYGRVELKLRDDTAERSSFTTGDSLERVFDSSPLELLDRDGATLMQQAIEYSRQQDGHILNQIPYIEAQVRGGVTTQDIESAVITIKPNDLDQQLVSSLHELNAQNPDCTIVVNLDYTSAQKLPIDTIRALDFVEFRPVVISSGDPISIQRNSLGYQNGGDRSSEYRHSEDTERLSALGRKFLQFFSEHERPDNLNDPALSHFRNGDRFPPEK